MLGLGILIGVCIATQVFLTAALAYAGWRYGYKPWLVMRADVTAVVAAMEALRNEYKAELGLRNARQLSDEEEARMEAVVRRREGRARFGL